MLAVLEEPSEPVKSRPSLLRGPPVPTDCWSLAFIRTILTQVGWSVNTGAVGTPPPGSLQNGDRFTFVLGDISTRYKKIEI